MNQSYMKEKPILPLLLSLALPSMISMLVNSLYNIIDSIFVAKMGESAMTAISLVSSAKSNYFNCCWIWCWY